MNDLEKFINLYESFGIKCIVNNESDGTKSIILCSHTIRRDHEKFTFSDNNLFVGFLDFYSEVSFNENGKFIKQGFWE